MIFRFNLWIWAVFAKLQIATMCFVMCVRLCLPVCSSVRPHGTTRLPPEEFPWNLIFEYFSKICRENSIFITTWQEKRVLYMKFKIYFWSYLAAFFWEWKMYQAKVVEKIKRHFTFNNFFPKIIPFMRYVMWTSTECMYVRENNGVWTTHKKVGEPDRPQMAMQYRACALHVWCLRIQTHT